MSLKKYFERELATLGYTDVSVEYSLGHCQGDGVAWYGTPDGDGLVKIATRIFTGRDLFRVIRFINQNGASIHIQRNSYGTHYAHENTMDLTEESGDIDEDKEKEVVKAWQDFVAAIGEDVKDVSVRLRNIGYDIVDSLLFEKESVWEFCTPTVRAEITHEAEDDYLSFASEEEIEDLAAGHGKYKVAMVCARVFQITDTGEEIGYASLGAVSYNEKDDKAYLREIWREVLSEAVSEARKVLPKQVRLEPKMAA